MYNERMKSEGGSDVGKGLKVGSLAGLAVTAFAGATGILGAAAVVPLVAYNTGTYLWGSKLDKDF